ncbi:MAG: ABC transporter ATP-binding protein [Thermosynechococcaceae cyanobacterium]
MMSRTSGAGAWGQAKRSPAFEGQKEPGIDERLILKLQGITKYYESQAMPAVNQVDLTLREGDILGLLGPSGCGKTTLLRFIAGFEKAQAGSLWLGDRLVASPKVWVPPEARAVGMVFQDFALFPHLTVYENIAFGLKGAMHRQIAPIGRRVVEVLDLVGLAGFQKRYPHELSGGQQQRVALARALAPKPNLVLLDEPLSNLDVQVRLHLRQELRTILKAAQTSAIFVTHDQEEALAISDQVAVMRCGQVEQLGSPEAIYDAPQSKFVAEFVTQANFLDAQRQGQDWQTEVGLFTVATPQAMAEPAEHGLLMIRQEDLMLSPDHQGRAIICDRQFLGRDYRYCLRMRSGKTLHALQRNSTVLPVGATVTVTAQPDAVRVFPHSMP